MSKQADEPTTGKKSPKGKKSKKSKKGNDAGGPSVANHPRARAAVSRAKGFGGLGGFVFAGYLSLKAGVPADQVGLRALGAGIVGYVLAWAVSVSVWRHLVLAEIHAVLAQHAPRQAEVLPSEAGEE